MRVPLLAGGAIMAAVTIGLLYLFANRAIYYPSKYPDGCWDTQKSAGTSDAWIDTGGLTFKIGGSQRIK